MKLAQNMIRFEAEQDNCRVTFTENGQQYVTSPRSKKVWRVLLYIAFHQKYPPRATQDEVISYLNSIGFGVKASRLAHWWPNRVYRAYATRERNVVYRSDGHLEPCLDFYVKRFPPPTKRGDPPSRVGLESLKYEVELPEDEILTRLGIDITKKHATVTRKTVATTPRPNDARTALLQFTETEHKRWWETPYSRFLERLAEELNAPSEIRCQPQIPPAQLYDLRAAPDQSTPLGDVSAQAQQTDTASLSSAVLQKLLREPGPMVLCGPPGHGKSTLLRYVAFERAKRAIRSPKELVPIYVAARRLPPSAFYSRGALESALISALPLEQHDAVRQVFSRVLWCIDGVSEYHNLPHLDGLREFVASSKCILAGRPSGLFDQLLREHALAKDCLFLLMARDVHPLLSGNATWGTGVSDPVIRRLKTLDEPLWDVVGSTPLAYLGLRVLQCDRSCDLSDGAAVLARLPELCVRFHAEHHSPAVVSASVPVMQQLCYTLLRRENRDEQKTITVPGELPQVLPISQALRAASAVLCSKGMDISAARDVLDFLEHVGLLECRATSSGAVYQCGWHDLFLAHFAAKRLAARIQRDPWRAASEHGEPQWIWPWALAMRQARHLDTELLVAALGRSLAHSSLVLIADVNAELLGPTLTTEVKAYAEKVASTLEYLGTRYLCGTPPLRTAPRKSWTIRSRARQEAVCPPVAGGPPSVADWLDSARSRAERGTGAQSVEHCLREAESYAASLGEWIACARAWVDLRRAGGAAKRCLQHAEEGLRDEAGPLGNLVEAWLDLFGKRHARARLRKAECYVRSVFGWTDCALAWTKVLHDQREARRCLRAAEGLADTASTKVHCAVEFLHVLRDQGTALRMLRKTECKACSYEDWLKCAHGWGLLHQMADMERCLAEAARRASNSDELLKCTETFVFRQRDREKQRLCLVEAERMATTAQELVACAAAWSTLMEDRSAVRRCVSNAEARATSAPGLVACARLHSRLDSVADARRCLRAASRRADNVLDLVECARAWRSHFPDSAKAQQCLHKAAHHATQPWELLLCVEEWKGISVSGTPPGRAACPTSTTQNPPARTHREEGRPSGDEPVRRWVARAARRSHSPGELVWCAKAWKLLGGPAAAVHIPALLAKAGRKCTAAPHMIHMARSMMDLLGNRGEAQRILAVARRRAHGVAELCQCACAYISLRGDTKRASVCVRRAEDNARSVFDWIDCAAAWRNALDNKVEASRCLQVATRRAEHPFHLTACAEAWRKLVQDNTRGLQCMRDAERSAKRLFHWGDCARVWEKVFCSPMAARRCRTRVQLLQRARCPQHGKQHS